MTWADNKREPNPTLALSVPVSNISETGMLIFINSCPGRCLVFSPFRRLNGSGYGNVPDKDIITFAVTIKKLVSRNRDPQK